jgi:hypothetical protein
MKFLTKDTRNKTKSISTSFATETRAVQGNLKSFQVELLWDTVKKLEMEGDIFETRLPPLKVHLA